MDLVHIFEYFSLKIGHIFLVSLRTLPSKIKYPLFINHYCGLNKEKRLRFYMIIT